MSRPRQELMEYRHQALLDELNEFCMALKVHLWHPGNTSLCQRHPKPTVKEIDELQARINAALREDAVPLIKR